MRDRTLWLRICYWWGIAAAEAMAFLMLSPPLFQRFLGIRLPLDAGLTWVSWPKNTSVLELCANALVLAEKPIRPKELTTEDAESGSIRRV